MSNVTLHGTLTATAAAVVTAGANETINLTKVLVTNTDSVPRTVDVHYDKTGSEGALTANKVISAEPLAAGQAKVLILSAVTVNNGSKLLMKADVTSVVNWIVSYSSDAQKP